MRFIGTNRCQGCTAPCPLRPRARLTPERRDYLRQILWRTTLLHTCVGHPLAAILSRFFGLRDLAEIVHYHTLPKRIKRRRSRESLAFSHDPRIFWADAFWGVFASVCRAFGWNRAASFFFHRGPVAAVREVGAMDYAPVRRSA